MKFGVHAPNFGSFGDARALADFAAAAEAAGWDGFFLWDHLIWDRPTPQPMASVWVALTAMALATHRLVLGTLITPLARYQPWELARVLTTLDELAGGRIVFGVGLGEDGMREYTGFGAVGDDRTHAAQVDEALAVMTGLWTAAPFSFRGEHFVVDSVRFLPAPRQTPRIPIWVGGNWPRRRPFIRAARWDGVAPVSQLGPMTLAQLDDMRRFIRARRSQAAALDIVRIGPLPVRDVAAEVAAFARVGVTWMIEDVAPLNGEPDRIADRLRRGPLGGAGALRSGG
jgi:alkanesulfonate monooxygenase SsuD/methylene tetrahydromethanopterin reductase-like flavin-dependent oxidoreductase (luciferase family)